MKTALVTGGAGFIGGALVDKLVRSGEYSKIVVFDNLVTNPRGVREGCHFVHGDVRIADDVSRLLFSGPFDEVFHFAASFANELSVNYPRIDLGSNVTGTVNLLVGLKGNFGRFVYAGSSSSYGNSRGTAFKEDDMIFPSTPYAISKHVGEEYVQTIAPNWQVFRFFNVFGEGDIPGKFRNMIPNMVAKGMLHRKIVTFGVEKNAGRDFTYVDDLVSVMSKSDLIDNNEVYNLCSGQLSFVKLIAEQIQEALADAGFEVEIDQQPIRGWDKVVQRWGDSGKIMKQLKKSGIGLSLRTFEGDVATRTIEWVIDYVKKNERQLRNELVQ